MDDIPQLSVSSKPTGLSLPELLVSLAVSMLVLSLAMQSLNQMTRHLVELERGGDASDEAKQLNEYLASALMATGGGPIRPWAALKVTDNYADTGADRITFAELESHFTQCTIQSVSGAVVTLDKTAGCCLTQSMLKRQVLLISGAADNNAHWENKRIDAVDLVNCRVTASAGFATALNVLPASTTAWAEGVLQVVTVHTLWVNTQAHFLMVDEDFDADGTLDSRIVADRVLDLQAALGFDTSPWDWHMNDLGNTSDEWLYNASGDTFGLGDGQGLANATLEDLRMIRFGVIIGAPTGTARSYSPVQLLNGPPRSLPGWILRSFIGVTGLRNYDIMR